MKSIFLTAESHMAAADIEGVEFTRAASDSPEHQRAVAQLVDDAKADVILRNEWCAIAPEAPAEKPVAAPIVARDPDKSEPAK